METDLSAQASAMMLYSEMKKSRPKKTIQKMTYRQDTAAGDGLAGVAGARWAIRSLPVLWPRPRLHHRGPSAHRLRHRLWPSVAPAFRGPRAGGTARERAAAGWRLAR